jgi:6-pyruvoyltetrahydropterin/6-carboxytetrahydropterin synthase
MPIVIGKRFTFDAAHRLGRHEGKCHRPHGHTYILEIDLTGPNVADGSGQFMVVDYYHIKDVVEREIMSRFDHQDLNVVVKKMYPELEPEIDNVTTAENLVVIIANLLGPAFYAVAPHAMLTRVRLQETPNSWAEWRPEANDSGVDH